jgi:hypothetical protein
MKVEFSDEATGIGESVWLRVDRCDDEKQLVYGSLDSEPLHDYGGQIGLGSELAVSFSQIRKHRKPPSHVIIARIDQIGCRTRHVFPERSPTRLFEAGRNEPVLWHFA